MYILTSTLESTSSEKERDKFEFGHENINDAINRFLEVSTESVDIGDNFKAKIKSIYSIQELIKLFEEDTKRHFESEARTQKDYFTMCLNGHSNFPPAYYLVPVMLGFVTALVPGFVRTSRSEEFVPTHSAAASFVACNYILTSLVALIWVLMIIHTWLKEAALIVYQFAALSQGIQGKRYGLKVYIPLKSPHNFEGWLNARRVVFNQSKKKLDAIFPMGYVVSPLLVILVLFFAAVITEGQLFVFEETDDVVRFYMLNFLIIYTLLLLDTAAHMNHLLNKNVIEAIYNERLEQTADNAQIMESRLATVRANAKHFAKNNRRKALSDSSGDAAIMGTEVKHSRLDEQKSTPLDEKLTPGGNAEGLAPLHYQELLWELTEKHIEGQKGMYMEQTRVAAEALVKSADGLYMEIFGVEVSYGLLATVTTALVTIVVAGISQAQAA
eukprot:CAMPEP_0167771638 /NCGR_PEP_ID=MMETSP0111_2-20121227/393_1 /TAXON_ID=91324 /ORGANISM="Lotharella globosa, Strain CCCM811" /LENGTH=441 /DNA_ID=CAMNT_0007661021 /DNA_START=247 /DNA_END=1572 /DNA_ORIENTATION=-